MAARKFWLQLPRTYFTRLSQRKMRKQPDGEIMQIIYLKLLLACIGNSGLILYQGIYDSLSEEIAEEIDEEPEIVQKTIDYILKNNMARTIADEEGDGYFFPESDEFTGSESESAERMRRMRERIKASQCDGAVTESDNSVTDSDDNKVKHKKVNVKKNIIDSSLHFTKEGDALPPSADAGGAHTFTFTEIQKCVEENGIDLSDKGITAFYKWMEKYGWKINGRKVTKLENALSGYAKKHLEYSLDQVEPERPEAVEKKSPESDKKRIDDSICKKVKKYMSAEDVIKYGTRGAWRAHIPDYCPKDIFTDEEIVYLSLYFNAEWDLPFE